MINVKRLVKFLMGIMVARPADIFDTYKQETRVDTLGNFGSSGNSVKPPTPINLFDWECVRLNETPSLNLCHQFARGQQCPAFKAGKCNVIHPCIAYSGVDGCTRGEGCWYSHAAFPTCAKHFRGECKYSDMCTKSHHWARDLKVPDLLLKVWFQIQSPLKLTSTDEGFYRSEP